MQKITIDPEHPEQQLVRKIAQALMDRKIAAIPTETFYALAVDPFDRESVERIYSLKGREAKKPIILLIEDDRIVPELVVDIPEIFRTLAEQFWPGPLTLLMKSSTRVPIWIDSGTGKIGLRVPSNRVVIEILRFIRRPLTGTSANTSGNPPAQTAQQVQRYFDQKIDLIVDGGSLSGGLASTLLDITSDVPVLLREGRIRKEEIEEALHTTVLLKDRSR